MRVDRRHPARFPGNELSIRGTARRMSATTRRTGIAAVATRAGVAPSTVSLYTNSPERVSPQLATRIQQAMDELQYRANPHARALRAATVEIVYVVLSHSGNALRVVGTFRDREDAISESSETEGAFVVESEMR